MNVTKEQHKIASQKNIAEEHHMNIAKEHHKATSQRNVTRASQRNITETSQRVGCRCNPSWSNNFVQTLSRANFGTDWQSDLEKRLWEKLRDFDGDEL